MEDSQRHDMIVSAVFLALSAFVVVATRNYPVPDREVGVRTFPLILAGMLAIVAALQLVRALRLHRRASDQSESDDADREADTGMTGSRTVGRLGVAFVAILAYVLVVRVVGFILTSIAFLAAMSTFFGERRVWMIAAFSIGAVASVYVLFGVVAGVPFPRGPVEEMLIGLGVI